MADVGDFNGKVILLPGGHKKRGCTSGTSADRAGLRRLDR